MKSSKGVLFLGLMTRVAVLLPPLSNDLIVEGHLRVANEVINRTDLEVLAEQYKRGGASSYGLQSFI